jgi:hypothetical protein
MNASLERARKQAIQDREDRETAEKQANLLEAGAVTPEELLAIMEQQAAASEKMQANRAKPK